MNIGSKKLYRSPSNSMVGGVCGGLGEYFGVDATLIRLAYVFFTLLFGFIVFGALIYLILWIVIPKEPIAPSAAVVDAPTEPPAEA